MIIFSIKCVGRRSSFPNCCSSFACPERVLVSHPLILHGNEWVKQSAAPLPAQQLRATRAAWRQDDARVGVTRGARWPDGRAEKHLGATSVDSQTGVCAKKLAKLVPRLCKTSRVNGIASIEPSSRSWSSVSSSTTARRAWYVSSQPQARSRAARAAAAGSVNVAFKDNVCNDGMRVLLGRRGAAGERCAEAASPPLGHTASSARPTSLVLPPVILCGACSRGIAAQLVGFPGRDDGRLAMGSGETVHRNVAVAQQPACTPQRLR
jgi:hypothetical protein